MSTDQESVDSAEHWQSLRPAFEEVDLTTKAKLKEFTELWRSKLVTINVGKAGWFLIWANLEWSIWESMRLIGGSDIPPVPAMDRRLILQAMDRVIDWCEVKDSEIKALKAVAESGLAGLLHSATKCKAGVRFTNIMRTMLAADRSRYEWSLRDWERELKASKRTIIACDGWRDVMAYRESQKAEAVSRKTVKKK